ncbi:hypothetical protein BS47DRAFT_914699 [Hydnum rufescens UP504]|uniref:Uncharacterized protein n=1 Tax=Hydnum rufescens UP504 TaxID=1448309 RepID=A0A9P6B926_9AGAM|nr:hypothetical protein BS47DRAFT_914699 [Hydnum rufescens UP504]
MCHMRHVWVGFEGCGHRYVAPNTPADGEKIDCGSDNCRMSELHPNWCVNATCRERGADVCRRYAFQSYLTPGPLSSLLRLLDIVGALRLGSSLQVIGSLPLSPPPLLLPRFSKTQPVHYFTKRWPQKCFNCINSGPGQAGGSSY